MGWVLELFRYPVKSAAGQSLRCVEVDSAGLHLDRTWACVDPADGLIGSAKHPRRWGQLLAARAWADDAINGDDVVHVRALGRQAVAGSAEADGLLSELLARPVRLTPVVPAEARLRRQLPDHDGLRPDWMADHQPGDEVTTAVAGARPGGRFVDYGPVHLVTTGALAELARQLARPQVAATRFRPNLVLDAAADPEPGQDIQIGDVVLRVTLPTPRCVVPGLPEPTEPGGPAEEAVDQELLSALARHHRADVGGLGRAACFGRYAEVVRPGYLEVGQGVARAG